MKASTFSVMIGLLVLAGGVSAGDWPAFRGPSGNGISAEKSAPVKWDSETNVKWKVSLPQPADGSPIVSNGKVFLTCAEDGEGKRRSLYCFDRKDGKKLWVKTVNFGRKMPTHKTNMYCGTTPAANGERVIVWHGSAGLYCYDFAGKEQWKRNLGEFRHMWGYGSSPVIYKGKVILNSGPGQRRVFVAALDLKNGKTIWQKDEPFKGDGNRNESGKPMGSWCTPVIAKVDGKDQVICTQPTRVVAYDPDNGNIIWSCDGIRHNKGDLAYSSPVVAGNILVAIGGYGGPGVGIRLGGGKGDVTASHRLWRNERNPQSIGSGVFVDGYVYMPQASSNRIDCIDPRTGEALWRERAGGNHWGSMVYVAGRLYVTDQKGTTAVFKPNPKKLELISSNKLGEPSNSTPAFSNGQIFIRTFRHLYCIAE